MKHIRANLVRRWLREPLLHFVILGVAVFELHHWVARSAMTRSIVLSDGVIHGLLQDHVRRYGTPPTADEEAAIIQRFIDNEVLYREALALGLDRGDIVVRRRLVQKMEFLTEDSDPVPEPTDSELQSYLDAHAVRYALPTHIALTHIFVGSDRHGSNAPADAAQLRRQLAAGADPAALGDPFLRGREFPSSTESELAAIFGPTFATQLMALPIGSWSDPIESSYGLHLVRVTARTPGREPQLAEVRASVHHDWQEDRRGELNRLALARLRGRYNIRIEGTDVPRAALAQVAVAK